MREWSEPNQEAGGHLLNIAQTVNTGREALSTAVIEEAWILLIAFQRLRGKTAVVKLISR